MEHKVTFQRTKEGFITKIIVEVYKGVSIYSTGWKSRNIHKLRCTKKNIIRLINKGTIFVDPGVSLWDEWGTYMDQDVTFTLITDDLRRIRHYAIKDLIDKLQKKRVKELTTRKGRHEHDNIEMMKRAHGKINNYNPRRPW